MKADLATTDAKKRVVITGIGMLASNGVGTEEVWQNCLEGVTNVSAIPSEWRTYYDSHSPIWAPLPAFDPKQYSVSQRELRQLHLSQLLFLVTAKMALDNSGIELTENGAKGNRLHINIADPYRFGVFYGTGCGGLTCALDNWQIHRQPVLTRFTSHIAHLLDEESQQMAEDLLSSRRFHPFTVSMVMPNAGAAKAGIQFGAKGPERTFCASCASGTVAVGQGFRAIQTGECQVVLAAASEFMGDESGYIFRGFDVLGTLTQYAGDPRQANRPFDKARSGFLFSEGGAATLVLESLEHAQNRGAEIIAEIVGYAETADAYSTMAIESSGGAIAKMFEQLLADAGIYAGEIDYVNCHGTGTELNDDVESRLLAKFFGRRPWLNATKSVLGHAIGASGALEVGVTALSLQRNQLHPCVNLTNPIVDLNWVTEKKAATLQYGISHSFGFGGHNAGVCLKKWMNQ